MWSLFAKAQSQWSCNGNDNNCAITESVTVPNKILNALHYSFFVDFVYKQ